MACLPLGENIVDLIYRFDPFRPLSVNRPADTEAAIDALVRGNQRLVHLIQQMQRATLDGGAADVKTVVPVDLVSMGLPLGSGAALDQAPFALVLGCSDARVPIESVFDQGFNDLFVIRIAGNVLGTECLGSFDYAIRNLGGSLKAVVVLGHTGCGAVTAAVDTYLSPNNYANIAFTHALRSLVDRVMVAVRGAAQAIERHSGSTIHRHPGFRTMLIETAVYLNTAITAFDLNRAVSDVTREGPAVFYGSCDVKTMLVRGLPAQGPGEAPQLYSAPTSPEQLVALGDQLARMIVAREAAATSSPKS